MLPSPLKKIILFSLLLIRYCASNEYDNALNQFLSHTHFRYIEIVNQVDDIQEIETKFIQWRQIKPGKTISIRLTANQRVVYNNQAYTSDFIIQNSDPLNCVDAFLEHYLLLTPVPQTPIKVSMLKSIKRKGSADFQYNLILPEEHEYNPMKQTQPLIIQLVRHSSPLLATLMPFDQEQLRTINMPMPEYTSYFRDDILPQLTTGNRDHHAVFQQSYDETLLKMQELSPNSALKIPLDIHTVWITHNQNPKMPSDKCYDLLCETAQTCSTQQGWRHHIWVHDKRHVPQHPILDNPVIIHEIGEVFQMPALKPFEILYQQPVAAGNYGKASDTARLAILYKQGGAYRDTDFAFIKTPKDLHRVCSFYTGLEGSEGLAPCNAMIASAPEHPILLLYLNIIRDNMITPLGPLNTLKNLPEKYNNFVHKTLFETGPFAFAAALYAAANDPDLINDICIAPSPVFFNPAYKTDR
ncbi:MAG TPA: hypothetical protein DIC42_05220, partial [Holosporales bacterium]|nr:hypothetical protein [Holosporales bacterium]